MTVRLGSEMSDWRETTSCAPQDSIHEPSVFLLSINDCLEESFGESAVFVDNI